jgi:hypothetical protein
MNVLIACEYSGTVRDAFAKRGHFAMSCDLLETESDGLHWTGDVAEILDMPWDLMVAHPPCDHLAVSGAAWFKQKQADGRQQQGIDFFMLMVNAPIPRIAIENPVGIMSRLYRKPDQIINPYQFGQPVSKKTCLWLKGLPLLKPTNIVEKSKYVTAPSGRSYPEWCWYTGGGSGKKRSMFFEGIAEAMADQWSQ